MRSERAPKDTGVQPPGYDVPVPTTKFCQTIKNVKKLNSIVPLWMQNEGNAIFVPK